MKFMKEFSILSYLRGHSNALMAVLVDGSVGVLSNCCSVGRFREGGLTQ